jgi:hypothetical protein
LCTYRNCARKKRICHPLQNKDKIVSRTFPLIPLLTVIVQEPQRVASLRLQDAPGKYTGPEKLLEFGFTALPISSLATAIRNAGGVNPVRIHQREGSSQVRVGAAFTIVAQSDDGVPQNATEVMLLEEALVQIPNESPMHEHRLMLVHPAFGTQELRL